MTAMMMRYMISKGKKKRRRRVLMIRRDWIIFGNRWHVRDRNRVHSFVYIMPSA